MPAMKSMWNEEDRRALCRRIGAVRPDAAPRWGRLSAPQMMAHLTDSLRVAFGELAPAPRKLPIRYPPLKQLIIYALPFPKNAPTAPEVISRRPADMQPEVTALTALVERFGREAQNRAWPAHPAFGPMSARAWGVLMYRHTDHHLRQFGV
ncbi:MAG: DUF1569 domain-containing protein [Acidimicrobiia bacterium]|nr:DUF1569 domain-containing protein [Acidimicrobiia bacterium]